MLKNIASDREFRGVKGPVARKRALKLLMQWIREEGHP